MILFTSDIVDPTSRRDGHKRESENGQKEIICAFGTDIDSVAGWIGSYGGGDSPSDIQRGIFASEVGNIRLLQPVQEVRSARPRFFIPGHSIETFPDQVKRIVDEGHEIGAHGYLAREPDRDDADAGRGGAGEMHRPDRKGLRQEAARLRRAVVGDVGSTAALLQKYGFNYDHSQGYRDFQPFYARVGDTWNVIDYSKKAEEWMHPLKHGKEIDLVEIGANWYVDDLPPMMFMKKAPNSHGFVNPRDIEELWQRRSSTGSIARWTTRCSPSPSIPTSAGRPQVLLMLERLIEHINGHDGVKWMTFEEIADGFPQALPVRAAASGRKSSEDRTTARRAAVASPLATERRTVCAQAADSRRRPATGPRPARRARRTGCAPASAAPRC